MATAFKQISRHVASANCAAGCVHSFLVTSGTVVATLEATRLEQYLTVIYNDAASTRGVSVTGNTNNINGSATAIILAPGEFIFIQSDGTDYKIALRYTIPSSGGTLTTTAGRVVNHSVNAGSETLGAHEYISQTCSFAAFTKTLPLNPVLGQKFVIKKTAGASALTIGHNTRNIDGVAGDIVVATGKTTTLVADSTTSWITFGKDV